MPTLNIRKQTYEKFYLLLGQELQTKARAAKTQEELRQLMKSKFGITPDYMLNTLMNFFEKHKKN